VRACPAGAVISWKEIEEIHVAVLDAIEFLTSSRNSFSVPNPRLRNAQDRDNEKLWARALRRNERLRNELYRMRTGKRRPRC
jgi:hypothetical protein